MIECRLCWPFIRPGVRPALMSAGCQASRLQPRAEINPPCWWVKMICQSFPQQVHRTGVVPYSLTCSARYVWQSGHQDVPPQSAERGQGDDGGPVEAGDPALPGVGEADGRSSSA